MSSSLSIKYISCRSEGMNLISYDFYFTSVTCKLQTKRRNSMGATLSQTSASLGPNPIQSGAGTLRTDAEMHEGRVKVASLNNPRFLRRLSADSTGGWVMSCRETFFDLHGASSPPNERREMTSPRRRQLRGRIAQKILSCAGPTTNFITPGH